MLWSINESENQEKKKDILSENSQNGRKYCKLYIW